MTKQTPSPIFSNAYAPFLDGFDIVPPDKTPFITLDKHRRFYLNATLRDMFGIKAYDRVALAYRAETKHLAIMTDAAADVIEAPTYFVDKRHYMSARRFCSDYQYDVEDGPFTFKYDRAASVPGLYFFRLARA